jgi:hypothetical protein
MPPREANLGHAEEKIGKGLLGIPVDPAIEAPCNNPSS